MEILNPAFDYDGKEHNYSQVRRADPRIMAYIRSALESSDTVLNVGAGAGSYEPDDKYVIAVEPSSVMRSKRMLSGKRPALNAKADHLPFDDASFDAVLAVLTVHHWHDLGAGLREIKRVAKKKIVILTYDPTQLDVFWNIHYFPDVVEIERKRYPNLEVIADLLGIQPDITNIRIPFDCSDGFQEAFYGRPEYFLNEEVRKAQSAWGFVDKDVEKRYVAALENDLESGEWDKRYGSHRSLEHFEGAYRMLEFNLTAGSG